MTPLPEEDGDNENEPYDEEEPDLWVLFLLIGIPLIMALSLHFH